MQKEYLIAVHIVAMSRQIARTLSSLPAESRLVYLSAVAIINTNYDNLVDLELQWSL